MNNEQLQINPQDVVNELLNQIANLTGELAMAAATNKMLLAKIQENETHEIVEE